MDPVYLYNLISGLVVTISFPLYNEQIQHILRIVLFPTSCFLSPPSGLSLFSSGRTCPWPLPPNENSEAHLLSPTHSFSALLEVRCKPGFTLPNSLDATIRRCQGDRQWSGDEPICTGRFEFNRKTFFVTSGPFIMEFITQVMNISVFVVLVYLKVNIL